LLLNDRNDDAAIETTKMVRPRPDLIGLDED